MTDTPRSKARPAGGIVVLLSPPWFAGLWRPRRSCRPNGARSRRRARMADQGADARSHRHLPVAARSARHSGRDLRRLSARRFLGGLDRRLGIHPAEFFDRRRIGRALCPARRPQAGHRDFLRRQSGGDRADPALLLSARQARHGGQTAMGDRGPYASSSPWSCRPKSRSCFSALASSAFSITAICFAVRQPSSCQLALPVALLARGAPRHPARPSASSCCSFSRRARSLSAAVL